MAEDQVQSQLLLRRSAFSQAEALAEKSEFPPYGDDPRRFAPKGSPEHAAYWTDERRELERQRARAQIAAGNFGAANGFHRRKTKKFYEIAAEHAQEHADEIIKKLDELVHGKDKHLALKAIQEYGALEERAVRNSREDEKSLRGLTNAQLEERLLDVFGDALGLDLTSLLGDVVEAETVEDEVLVQAIAGVTAASGEDDDGDKA